MAEILPIMARDWALFLDVDGTLLDYAPRPDAVIVPASLPAILAGLSGALGGALAIVSGRAIADLDRLFAPLRLPSAGQHGAEARRDDHTCLLAPPSSALASILEPVYALGAQDPAIRIENKGLSAAIHYRESGPEHEALSAILPAAIAKSGGAFQLRMSRLAFDIVPRIANKGRAVAWFMERAPFVGRVPVFIGDDRTDEDGFAAVLARGGHAIKVGPRRDSLAPLHMKTPQELRVWLERSLALLGTS